MGPVITCAARDRITGLIDRGVSEGASLVVDGRRPTIAGHPSGFFVGPTLFDRVTPDMTIYREEIFGPVLIVVRSESLNDAVAMINGNPYANGAALFTRSGHAARRFQQDVEVGMAGINVPIPVPMAFYSFGGWRNSLFGDLNVHGTDGIRFYTRLKTVTARWPAPSRAVRNRSRTKAVSSAISTVLTATMVVAVTRVTYRSGPALAVGRVARTVSSSL